MPGARDIKARIKGVKSTGKITRAMEMISAVKMRKAAQNVLAIRPFAEAALHVLGRLEQAVGSDAHPLLATRPIKKELYVVITSNRGLCGAFNAQVLKRLRQALAEDKDREQVCITIGKKGENALRRMGKEIIATFPDVLNTPKPEDMRSIARIIMEEFVSARVDRVVMIYTDYVSVMVQDVKLRALLPVRLKDSMRALNEVDGTDEVMVEKVTTQAEYTIEPNPESVLNTMIPKLIEMELYHAILESNASQEAARMMAMRNATDAAKEMAEDYTLMYNQLRQQKITQEIAELSAGMAAVS